MQGFAYRQKYSRSSIPKSSKDYFATLRLDAGENREWRFSQLTLRPTGASFSLVIQAINLNIQRGLHSCGSPVDEYRQV